MPLRSRLFAGDAKLEAAATRDAAHIVQGASGPHVAKIQSALIRLDGADIIADSRYGPKTAAAVKAYKSARNVINRSYQSSADDIVGKMTLAQMDEELLAREALQVTVDDSRCDFAKHHRLRVAMRLE